MLERLLTSLEACDGGRDLDTARQEVGEAWKDDEEDESEDSGAGKNTGFASKGHGRGHGISQVMPQERCWSFGKLKNSDGDLDTRPTQCSRRRSSVAELRDAWAPEHVSLQGHLWRVLS